MEKKQEELFAKYKNELLRAQINRCDRERLKVNITDLVACYADAVLPLLLSGEDPGGYVIALLLSPLTGIRLEFFRGEKMRVVTEVRFLLLGTFPRSCYFIFFIY